MKLFFTVVKFNWLKILAYPFEIIAFFACRLIALGMLALFWYAFSQSTCGAMDFKPLVAYFLVAAAIKDLTFSTDFKFGRYIQKIIMQGEISNYFIKPVKTVPFLFFSYAGENGMGIVYAFISLTIGLVVLPPASWVNVVAFIIFLFIALFVSVAFNTLIGIISFHSTEGSGFRNAINHVIKILSGAIIPLTLFPVGIREIILLLPFPALVFTPAYVLQNNLSGRELLFTFSVSLGWAIALFFLTHYLWRYSVKKYEGVGI